jgi:Lrp/AsnC family leucine-responsive transcriptional regulator
MIAPSSKLLDTKGWELLKELQIDARLSYAELGRRVGLSTPAVAERVRNLEAAGIISGYRAELDLKKLGLPILAMIRISAVGDVLPRITAVVRAMPEVLECHRGTGADSFTMKVAVSSVSHLETLIDRLTPFGPTSTSIVLSSPVEKRLIERPAVPPARPAKGPKTAGRAD